VPRSAGQKSSHGKHIFCNGLSALVYIAQTPTALDWHQAWETVRSFLDTNHDRTLTTAEKGEARIIIYGHSWGASEAITLARKLEKNAIPVLLTIQIESVS
jgi:surfactin synthase thioesterase subunit